MRLLSATCLAIAIADQAGTLRIIERDSRFGGVFYAIEDEVGLIEVCLDRAEVNARLADIRARAA